MTNNLHLHHIGYTVSDIASTTGQFAAFGYVAGETLHDNGLQVQLCYLTCPGAVRIELVHQLQADSLEAQILASNGVMPYHMAYECIDFKAACASLDRSGYKRLFEPVQVEVLGGKRICYFHHPQTGYVELIEKCF